MKRTPPKTQLPLIKAAALELIARRGRKVNYSRFEGKKVNLGVVRLSVVILPRKTQLEIWDYSRGGDKVLNINWSGGGTIEVVSFRRGDWERFVIDQGKPPENSADIPQLWFDQFPQKPQC